MDILNALWSWFAADFPSWGYILLFVGAGFFGANIVNFDVAEEMKNTRTVKITARIMTLGIPGVPNVGFGILYVAQYLWVLGTILANGFGSVDFDEPLLLSAEFRMILLGIITYCAMWAAGFGLTRGRRLVAS